MKISTVLDHIDSGHMALREFRRGSWQLVTEIVERSAPTFQLRPIYAP